MFSRCILYLICILLVSGCAEQSSSPEQGPPAKPDVQGGTSTQEHPSAPTVANPGNLIFGVWIHDFPVNGQRPTIQYQVGIGTNYSVFTAVCLFPNKQFLTASVRVQTELTGALFSILRSASRSEYKNGLRCSVRTFSGSYLFTVEGSQLVLARTDDTSITDLFSRTYRKIN